MSPQMRIAHCPRLSADRKNVAVCSVVAIIFSWLLSKKAKFTNKTRLQDLYFGLAVLFFQNFKEIGIFLKFRFCKADTNVV